MRPLVACAIEGAEWRAGRSSVLKDMDHTMTEIEDYLSYVGDVIEVASPRLRAEVSRKFWDGFVEPIVVGPLLAANVRSPPILPVTHASVVRTGRDCLVCISLG